MINLKNINLEYKSTVLFGISALVMSLLTGIILGIRWNTIILRSIVLSGIFAGIGFGMCVIVKKYVPEMYDFLISLAGRTKGDQQEPGKSGLDEYTKTGQVQGDMTPDIAPGSMAATKETPFKELDKEVLDHYTTSTAAPAGSDSINTAKGKLGKHILQTEKLAKYEPKIMAQAVRTMIKRDE